MAEIFTNEGLDYLLDIFPRATRSEPTTIYCGLFTSQTSTTVPASSATGGVTPSGWTEMTSTGGYARVAIPNTAWGTQVSSGNGRRTTASIVTFPVSTAAYGATGNGFFLATNSSSGVGDVIFYFANDDSNGTVSVGSSGLTPTVTPFWHVDS